MTETADGSADPDEDGLLLWELVRTAHLAERAFRDLFATVGLTPTQFGVLACLADGDDFTKAELARAVLVRPQSMDPLIDALLGEGLVVRDGPAGRGRAAGISITAAGSERLARVRPRVGDLNAPERLGLTEAQAAEVLAGLRTVRERLA